MEALPLTPRRCDSDPRCTGLWVEKAVSYSHPTFEQEEYQEPWLLWMIAENASPMIWNPDQGKRREMNISDWP